MNSRATRLSSTVRNTEFTRAIFREFFRQLVGELPESSIAPEDITMEVDLEGKKLTVTLCTRNPYIREALSRIPA